jgi:hypothetical protein
MSKVIETNFFKSEKLREYLSDPTNVTIVPDFAVMATLAELASTPVR